MMISPDSYYEMYLKGKSEEQLLSAIRGLKNKIGHLKILIESHRCDELIKPSEKVQISCNREYLERAKLALSDIGGEYKPSRSEVAASEFQENLDDLKSICFNIGGFFGGFTEYKIEITETEAYLTSDKFADVIGKKQLDKDELMYNLQRLYIGEWLKNYNPRRFGVYVLDGTQWSVIFEYNNGHKTAKYSGSNDYPYNFDEFLEIFGLDYSLEIGEEDEK